MRRGPCCAARGTMSIAAFFYPHFSIAKTYNNDNTAVIRNAHQGWSYLAKFQKNDMGEKAAAIPSYAEIKGTNKAERIAS